MPLSLGTQTYHVKMVSGHQQIICKKKSNKMNDKMNNPEKQNLKFNEILQHQSTCLYIKKKTKYLYKSSCLHGSFQFSSRKSSTKNTVILYNILIHVFLPSRTTDRFSKILDNKEGSGRNSPPPPLHLHNCTGSQITYRFVS